MDTKLILGQEQLALQAKLNLGIYEKRTNYHMCRGKGKKKKGAGKKKGAREDRAQQLEPMAAKGVAYIDSENKKLVHIEDYASHLQGKPSVFAGETGKYLCEQELSITVSADDWIDEFYFNGSDERHRLSDPTGCCTLKRCTLKYDPLAEEGAVLAIAGNDNQPGTSASFGLRVESSAGWKIELSMENAEALGAKVFGIKGPESHDIEVGPMGRPSNMSPPEGWTSNDFDDREWSLPTKSTNGNHF